jgi:hypothetical protein
MIETEYVASLSDKERQAYEVAKAHLGTLFDVENTNGFLMWKKNLEKTKKIS